MEPLSKSEDWELFAAKLKCAVGISAIFISLLWLPLANGFITIPDIVRLIPASGGSPSPGEYSLISLILALTGYWGIVTALDGSVVWKKLNVKRFGDGDRNLSKDLNLNQTLFQ